MTELIHDFKQIIKRLCVRDLKNVLNVLDPPTFAGDPDLFFNR